MAAHREMAIDLVDTQVFDEVAEAADVELKN
jgi:hypothetical protein